MTTAMNLIILTIIILLIIKILAGAPMHVRHVVLLVVLRVVLMPWALLTSIAMLVAQAVLGKSLGHPRWRGELRAVLGKSLGHPVRRGELRAVMGKSLGRPLHTAHWGHLSESLGCVLNESLDRHRGERLNESLERHRGDRLELRLRLRLNSGLAIFVSIFLRLLFLLFAGN